MKQYLYLFINVGCIIIPFIFSFLLKHKFYKQWRYFIPANIIIAILFIIWDHIFVEMGVWGFRSDYLTGLFITQNIPLEEGLFFICIPYACVFTYFVIREYYPKINLIYKSRITLSILFIFSSILFISNIDKMYTAYTFGLLSIVLLFCFYRRINVNTITISFISILPFMFLSNGLLTGMFIENEVVWYNDVQNLGFRIFTIPIEDFFYGYLLILLNVLLYEAFRNINFLNFVKK